MIIYVYKDRGRGCSSFSADNLRFSLAMALGRFNFDVRYISPEEIIEGSLLRSQNTKMLAIGGGRFTEVKKALGERGLNNIKHYVEEGGLYTGICMGSYAAFTNIDFQGEQKRQGVGLGFFNTTARGSLPVITPYDGTGNSATIVEIQHLKHAAKFPSLYWGGNGMDMTDLEKIGATPLSTLKLGNGEEKVMSAQISVGDNGGKAFLCGYHPEGYNRKTIWQWLTGLSPNASCYRRLESELLAHPDKAYIMAMACLLDDIKLVPEHSFVQHVYNAGEYSPQHTEAIDPGIIASRLHQPSLQ